jgi:hypothetical protein
MRRAAGYMSLMAMVAVAATGAACRDSSADDDMVTIDAALADDGGHINIDGGAGGMTVYDVQDPAKAMPEGTLVTLTNVVVTAIDLYGGTVGSIYVQDPAGGPYSGVFVYSPTGAGSIVVGDVVTVSGGAKKEFSLSVVAPDPIDHTVTEISPPMGGTITVTKTGTGTAPTPPVVDPSKLATDAAEAEKWEGVPVTVQNVAVLSPPAAFGNTPATDKRQMTITGGLIVQSSMTGLGAGDTEYLQNDCFASLTGIVDYFFTYHLQPRVPGDFVTGTDCHVTTGPATVVNIQNGMIPTSSQVSLTGVVVTAVAKFKNAASTTQETRVWVADSATAAPYNGVLVFKATISGTNNASIDNLVPGDIVDVSGLVTEFHDETEIAGTTTIVRTGTGPAPTPVVLPLATLLDPAMAEQYEGVLVKIENTKVVSTNPDSAGTPPDVGEWTVGTAGAALRIDDIMFKRPTDLAVDQCFASITGALDFTFSNYKIEPRAVADTVGGGTCQ